jgi:hypothetical protein
VQSVYDPKMGMRAVAVGVIAALALLLLSGCQATAPGTFVRADARADAAHWTRDAVTAVGGQKATTKADGFETCRTDTGYFTTTSQWRTITFVSIPASRQPAAESEISAAFVREGWVASHPQGLLMLVGPDAGKRHGLIRAESGGGAQLAITVISPCYH